MACAQPRIGLALAVLVGAACVLGMPACHEQHAGGKITVDRPEVFTRERLVNRRLAEQDWLQGQLDRNVDSTFQAYRDVRTFEGLYAKAEVQARIDPLAGQLNQKRAIDAETDVVRAKTSLATARKDRLTAERELRNARSGAKSGDTGGDSADKSQDDASGGIGQNSVGASDSSSDELSTPERSGLFGKSATDTLPGLPDPSTLVKTSGRLTSVEELRDRAAYRNAVSALMREQELDDTHDLFGRSIYTLKFDVSVIAGDRCDALGRVSCMLQNCNTDAGKGLYEAWVKRFKEDVELETVRLEQRIEMGYAAEQDVGPLTMNWKKCLEIAIQTMFDSLAAENAQYELLTSTGPTDTLRADRVAANLSGDSHEREAAKQQLLRSNLPRSAADKVAQMGEDIANLAAHRPLSPGTDRSDCQKQAVARLVQSRYEGPLKDLVEFGELTPYDAVGGHWWVPSVKTVDGGDKVLPKRLGNGCDDAYVYSVEPKELAQNASDVAAKENLTNLVASLGLSLVPSATNLKGYAEYMRRSQTLLQGIVRKPLVVGYCDGESTFGWLLGPRFKIEGDELGFGHTAVQHSVQATVVVPAWWPRLRIKTCTDWIDDDGDHLKEAGPADNKDRSFDVDLPVDLSAITSALIAKADGPALRPRPRIDPRFAAEAGGRRIAVARGRNDVLIRGRDLWRTPEVYIGAQRADSVRVMPDMLGVVASFNDLRPPARASSPFADLRIVTSGGEDVLVDGVEFAAPPASARGVLPFLTLMSAYLATDKALPRFKVDQSAAPRGFRELQLQVISTDPNAPGETLTLKNYTPKFGDGAPPTVAFQLTDIPASAPKWWTNSSRVTLRPQIKLVDDGPFIDAAVAPVTVVRFASEDDMALTRSGPDAPTLKVGDPTTLALSFRPAQAALAYEAFPKFAQVWAARTARLRITSGSIGESVAINGGTDKDLVFVSQQDLENAIKSLGERLKAKKFDIEFTVIGPDALETEVAIKPARKSAKAEIP